MSVKSCILSLETLGDGKLLHYTKLRHQVADIFPLHRKLESLGNAKPLGSSPSSKKYNTSRKTVKQFEHRTQKNKTVII